MMGFSHFVTHMNAELATVSDCLSRYSTGAGNENDGGGHAPPPRYTRPIFIEYRCTQEEQTDTQAAAGATANANNINTQPPPAVTSSAKCPIVQIEQAEDEMQLLVLEDARHPIMEYRALQARTSNTATSGRVHANTLHLSSADRLCLVYGANMSGKSTLLQQTGLVVILAHAGCYVPASFACLSPLAKVFARMGVSESLVRNQSHFLAETSELAHVLSNATERSLVLLDEVGRATSTRDGAALAYSVAEHLAADLRCLTLFTSHISELSALCAYEPAVRLLMLEAKTSTNGDAGGGGAHNNNNNAAIPKLHFTYALLSLSDGALPPQYGVALAQAVGMPASVVARAAEISKRCDERAGAFLERAAHDGGARGGAKDGGVEMREAASAFVNALREVNKKS